VPKIDVLRGESQIASTCPRRTPGAWHDRGADRQCESPNQLFFFVLSNDHPKVSSVTSNPNFQEASRTGINYAGLVRQLWRQGGGSSGGVIPSTSSVLCLASEAPVFTDYCPAKACCWPPRAWDTPTVTMATPSYQCVGERD